MKMRSGNTFFRNSLALLFLLSLLSCAAVAQVRVNKAVEVAQAQDFVLPSLLDDIFFLDGQLHCSSDGMLLVIKTKDGIPQATEPDTAMLAVDPEMLYAVRNNATHTIFYTKRSAKDGTSELYEHYEKKPGKKAVRRIRPDRFSFSIEHPVFTPDGLTMIFSSDCPLGFGGMDLWYSQLRYGEWQYPQNMGHRVNTEGDDRAPALYGDFLIYSSNGKSDARGGFDLYGARLVATEQTGDTVMMYPIGRCPAFSLELPFCSIDDDMALTLSDQPGTGWWVVRHNSVSASDKSTDLFCRFKGDLRSVKLFGQVTGLQGKPVAKATVEVMQGTTRQSATCDNDGRFALFVREGVDCRLSVSAINYYTASVDFTPVRFNEERLYSVQSVDVPLDALTLDSLYSYGDLFNSSVSSELSVAGRRHVDSIALFLVQNPHLKLSLVSSFDMSEDMPFCSLLNQSRLRSISARLEAKGVKPAAIVTSTSRPVTAPAIPDSDKVLPAVSSSLTVFFEIKSN